MITFDLLISFSAQSSGLAPELQANGVNQEDTISRRTLITLTNLTNSDPLMSPWSDEYSGRKRALE